MSPPPFLIFTKTSLPHNISCIQKWLPVPAVAPLLDRLEVVLALVYPQGKQLRVVPSLTRSAPGFPMPPPNMMPNFPPPLPPGWSEHLGECDVFSKLIISPGWQDPLLLQCGYEDIYVPPASPGCPRSADSSSGRPCCSSNREEAQEGEGQGQDAHSWYKLDARYHK